MEFLHIIQLNEKNTYNLFKQLHEKVDLRGHIFLVMNKKSNLRLFPKFEEFTNFIYLPEENIIKKGIVILKYFFMAKHVIFNSLIFNNKKYIIIFSLICWLKNNIYWIEWGGDLYNWKLPNSNISNFIINMFNKILRSRMRAIGVTIECDEIEVKRQFPTCKKVLYTPLPFGEERQEMLESIMKLDVHNNGTTNIQIAHNSLSINNHLQILNEIKKFSNKDIKVYLPLSYGFFGINGQFGGKEYIEKVVCSAKEEFGENAIVMDKGIPLDEYLFHLWSMDIGIFACRRPIGMANILYMLYMNKKIFLPRDTVLFKFLVDKDVPVFALEDISNMTFEEFVKPISGTKRNKWVYEKFIPFKEIMYWNDFFNEIRNMS